jgi:hypothetical protein
MPRLTTAQQLAANAAGTLQTFPAFAPLAAAEAVGQTIGAALAAAWPSRADLVTIVNVRSTDPDRDTLAERERLELVARSVFGAIMGRWQPLVLALLGPLALDPSIVGEVATAVAGNALAAATDPASPWSLVT